MQVIYTCGLFANFAVWVFTVISCDISLFT